MENQNRLKLRISRMFRSSFGSCKSRENSDVLKRPQNSQHHQLIELFSPRPRPFSSSTCRPRCSETELFPRSKVSDRNSLLAPVRTGGRKFPPVPVSPSSPLNSFFEFRESEKKKQEKKSRRTKTKKCSRSLLMEKCSFESFDNYYDWFSSSDDDDYSEVIEVDDDETTLFSSKSLSSDSSESLRRNKARFRRKRAPTKKKKSQKGIPNPMPALHGKVKDSFAVVKRSSDPYSDFRTSMVEMIIERQIFGARDLENLLQTFLSLNSNHHHRVIVEVFTEIWETLFSDWS